MRKQEEQEFSEMRTKLANYLFLVFNKPQDARNTDFSRCSSMGEWQIKRSVWGERSGGASEVMLVPRKGSCPQGKRQMGRNSHASKSDSERPLLSQMA